MTILYRYAGYKGYDTTVSSSLGSFADGNSVSAYAQEGMQWAIGAGLISGYTDGTVNPTANATRAEVAAIMTRFIQFAVYSR